MNSEVIAALELIISASTHTLDWFLLFKEIFLGYCFLQGKGSSAGPDPDKLGNHLNLECGVWYIILAEIKYSVMVCASPNFDQ